MVIPDRTERALIPRRTKVIPVLPETGGRGVATGGDVGGV